MPGPASLIVRRQSLHDMVEKFMNFRITSILGYLLMVLAIAALIALKSLLADSIPTATLQTAGIMLIVWARVTFGRRSFHLAANPTEGGLVTSGPYRFVRHPIYAAVLLFVTAGVITRLTLESIIWTLILIAGIALRVYTEEALIKHRYPEYAAYAAKTKRIIPFIL
jgi:protein-S-isoprenylcysteine O-methyltransferase Ste14